MNIFLIKSIGEEIKLFDYKKFAMPYLLRKFE